MCKSYIYNERITLYPCGDFNREFYWNVPIITENSERKNGYIVQHIIRTTKDSKDIYTLNDDYNHEYWEAWPINNNKVNLPDYGFHDRWATPRPKIDIDCAIKYTLIEHINERKNSSGNIRMSGIVYWAPIGCELFNIVHNTFKTHCIKWAWELAATKDISDYQRFTPVFTHPDLYNTWNIDDNPDEEALITPHTTSF